MTLTAEEFIEQGIAQKWDTRFVQDRLRLLERHMPALFRAEMQIPFITNCLAASQWVNLPPIIQSALRRIIK